MVTHENNDELVIVVAMITIKYDKSDSRWTNERRDDLMASGLEFKSRVYVLSPWQGLSLSSWVRHVTATVPHTIYVCKQVSQI